MRLLFRIGARFRGALFGCSLVRIGLSLSIFFGFLLHRNYAGLLRGLHRVARHGDHGLGVALLPVGILCRLQLLIGFRDRGGGVFSGIRIVGDAHRIARLEEFDRRLAVDPENHVLNLCVRGRVHAAREQLVRGADTLAARRYRVFEDHFISRLGNGKIRFGGHDHSESLHVRNGLDLRIAILDLYFAKVDGAALWRNSPQDIRQVLETKLSCLFHALKFHFDFDAIPLVFDSGLRRCPQALRSSRGGKLSRHRRAGK